MKTIALLSLLLLSACGHVTSVALSYSPDGEKEFGAAFQFRNSGKRVVPAK